jgi:hypothetical protein
MSLEAAQALAATNLGLLGVAVLFIAVWIWAEAH